MVGTLISIEAHKRKEEHLSLQLNRLGSTLESLTEPVITVNSKARITYINSAARKLLELELSDVYSQPIDDVLCLECINEKNINDEIIHPVQMCFQQKKTVCTDCCSLITASGKSIPVDLTASPIELDDEGITGAVLILRNISQTRLLQDDLQHQATHDTLTDLWNRRAFEQRLKELQKDARHNNTQHALLYIDLDQFKIVNDTAVTLPVINFLFC